MGSLSMMSSGILLTHPGLLDTTPTFQRGIFEFFNLKNSTEFRATILNFKVKKCGFYVLPAIAPLLKELI